MVSPLVRFLGACLLVCAAWVGLSLGADDAKPAAAFAAPTQSESKPSEAAAPAAPGGPTVIMKGPDGSVRMGMPGGPGMPPGMPGGVPGKPGEPPKPGGDKSKPGEGAKPEEAPPAVQRPTAPPKPPDPSELKVRPDKEGKITFNFKGQPWPAVLEWLADISGMSLDWQKLPGDYLNLTTPRPYTVREARDLINRHLLARGFTMLVLGETLSVVNCKELNPALVPRIEADELPDRDPYEFVKVSFALDSLVAEDAAKEFEPMRSANGRLTPLRGTNRLEAIDAVINLREIYTLMVSEQSGSATQRIPREFPLQFAKASDVVEQLQGLLGMEEKGRSAGRSGGSMPPGMPPGMNPEMARQMAMAGQPMPPGGQQPGQPQQPGMPTRPKAEISLIANARKNSVLAIAPPDKMVIIAQAVKMLDVPPQQGSSLAGTLTRMQIYRLAAIDPEPLAKTLEEIGNLDPSTRLQVDKKNRALIAYAPLADHVTIRSLIDKLDGSERKFEVIQLRRLEADYVAGSIEFMMTGEKPKQSRRPYWSYDFDSRSRGAEEDKDKFRVDADVEGNRLMLWANPVELEEVRNLLVKLGEIPAEGGNPATVRVLDLPAGKESDDLVERLRRHWPAMAPNPLVLPPQPQKPAPAPAPEKKKEPPAAKTTSSKTVAFLQAAVGPPAPRPGQAQPTPAAQASEAPKAIAPPPEPAKPAAPAPAPAESPAPAEPPKPPATAETPPPITFSRGADGHWIVSSPDTQALDRLEEMVAQMSASSRVDYRVFLLKYAWATSVASVLKDLFKEEDEGRRRYSPFYFDFEYGSQDTEKPRSRLSKRKPLRIIADSDSNSILVQGGDAAQLKKIEELIKLYDQPQPLDAKSVRKTEVVTLQFSKAKVVAETVKDVYRDLLSSNDKSLAGGRGERPERFIRFVFDEDEKKQPTYKGLLSIGVDDVSNTLILSAPGYLLEDVVKMVKGLDEAARPVAETVSVVKLGPGVSAAQIEAAVGKAFGDTSTGSAGGNRGSLQAPTQGGQSGDQNRSRGQDGRSHNHGSNRSSESRRN